LFSAEKHTGHQAIIIEIIVSNFLLLKRIFNARRILYWFIFAALPALLFYWIAIEVLSSAGFSLKDIVRDPAQQTGQSSFLGFVSNVGVWLWVCSGAVCLFSVGVGGFATAQKQKQLLILIGTLSFVLAVDDFFLLHDRYLPQRIVFLCYAVFAITLLIRYFKNIMEIEGFAFLSAGCLLALSIFIDLNQRKIPFDYPQVQTAEEGFKFVGAASWLYFSYRLASFRLTRSADNTGQNGES
jgi:hypothetical protein